jgi:hypothetical protein
MVAVLAAGEGDIAATDGLSTLAKTPGSRSRKGTNGRKPVDGAPRRPPEGVEAPETRRRGRRGPADVPPPPPPVSWRGLAHPDEGPPPPPPPPVNWRELTAAAPEPPQPSRDLMIVPQRDPELVPRKVGFFERLGFGRRRQA